MKCSSEFGSSGSAATTACEKQALSQCVDCGALLCRECMTQCCAEVWCQFCVDDHRQRDCKEEPRLAA